MLRFKKVIYSPLTLYIIYDNIDVSNEVAIFFGKIFYSLKKFLKKPK